MPLPPDLEWDDRLAPYTHPQKGPGFYFLCRKKGHRDGVQKHTAFIAGPKADAKEYRNAHDTAHHNTLMRVAGFTPERNATISGLCNEYLAYIQRLEVAGSMDPKTVEVYHYLIEHFIRPGFRVIGVNTIRELAPSVISEFVAWAQKHSSSKGYAIGKALVALRTMSRWKGLPVDWKTPVRDINAQRREKRHLDAETIRRLISAMPEGSIEEAIAYLKARTGCRDVEIFKSRREEFDLEAGIFAPQLHQKRLGKRRRHVYALPQEVIAKVRPFVERAKPNDYVFKTRDGRPMHRNALRPLIKAASKRAGIVVKVRRSTFIGRGGKGRREYESIEGLIDSIAPIRAEVATTVVERTSLREAAENIGWDDERTLRAWYLKDRVTAQQLAERRRIAELIAEALPLR